MQLLKDSVALKPAGRAEGGSSSLRVSGNSRWLATSAMVVLAAIAIVRIALTYAITPQAFDEVCHVAAAIELLDRHTYTLDPVHPPLARIAIGLPLYVAGVRYPKLPPLDHVVTYTDVGNAILYAQDSGLEHYVRTLRLARLGVLPFFLLGTAVVFLWAKREYGELAGVMAAALFTTTPSILAFSSIAYTDIVAASTQAAAIFAFVAWLDKPTRRLALWLGFALGLALASKATTIMFFAAAATGTAAVKWFSTRVLVRIRYRQAVRQISLATGLACLTIWATYGFAFQRVRQGMNLSVEQIPSFQHFPTPLARVGRHLVLSDPLMPAPALVRGVAQAWELNKVRTDTYLLGQIRPGGWWYFFLVCMAVKTPIPILVLFFAGIIAGFSVGPATRWKALAPALAAMAILIITLPVKYQAGSRHILVVFPLLCVMAGCGAAYLWGGAMSWTNLANSNARLHKTRFAMRMAIIALFAWQGISTFRAGSDFLSYFNEFAGSNPGDILQGGCDLDCGQDLFRLAGEFQKRHVSRAAIAVWTSSVPNRMGLPEFEVPRPFHPVTGWVAISARAICCGAVFHEAFPTGAFDWLKAYKPAAYVGKTIRLYYIPGSPQTSSLN